MPYTGMLGISETMNRQMRRTRSNGPSGGCKPRNKSRSKMARTSRRKNRR